MVAMARPAPLKKKKKKKKKKKDYQYITKGHGWVRERRGGASGQKTKLDQTGNQLMATIPTLALVSATYMPK